MGRERVTNQPFDEDENKVSNNSLLNHVVKVNRWFTEEMTIQQNLQNLIESTIFFHSQAC